MSTEITIKRADDYKEISYSKLREGMTEALNECGKFIQEAAEKGQTSLRFDEKSPEVLMLFLQQDLGFQVTKLETGEFLVKWG